MKQKSLRHAQATLVPVLMEPRPPGARRLAPFKEACRYGNWGKSRAYELIEAGKIKAYKDGRKTLVDLNTIDEYHKSLPALPAK